MVIMLSIQGITYVKCAESCSSKVWTSDKPTYRVALWELRQRFQRFAGFTIAKQPTFPRNKFGMSETSCTIGLSSKFVKFHLVQGGNRQEITRNNNVVQGGKISLIRRSKSQPHACADVFQLCRSRRSRQNVLRVLSPVPAFVVSRFLVASFLRHRLCQICVQVSSSASNYKPFHSND